MDYSAYAQLIHAFKEGGYRLPGMEDPDVHTPEIVLCNVHSFFSNVARRVDNIFSNNPLVETSAANNCMLSLYQSMCMAYMALYRRADPSVSPSPPKQTTEPVVPVVIPSRRVSPDEVRSRSMETFKTNSYAEEPQDHHCLSQQIPASSTSTA